MLGEGRVKIDAKDRRILYWLDVDARMPASALAKRVGISKEGANYRINGLFESGVIDKALMVVDVGRLGFQFYKLYFQFQRITTAQERQILDYFIAHKRVAFMAHCEGKYDLVIALMARSPNDFNGILDGILKKFGSFIRSYDTTVTLEGKELSRKFLASEKEGKGVAKSEWTGPAVNVELDRTDAGILAILGEDGRMAAAEIARRMDISGDTVSKRMKGLMDSGVISGFHLQLNKTRMGYEYHKVMLTLEMISEKREREVMRYLEGHPNIVYVLKTLGPWNMEIDVEVRDDQPFYKVMRQMRDELGDVIRDYESVYVFEEPKFNFVPMGKKVLSS